MWAHNLHEHVFREYNSGIEHREDPFHPFTPEDWYQHSSTMLRTFLIQHLPNPIGPEPVLSGPMSSSRPAGYSPAAIELMGFKKGIKREIAAYPSVKDERYFDGFKRNLFIVAKTHEWNEVLVPNYTSDCEPKQTFMLVSSMLTSRLTWERPLSEDIWPTLMLKQHGKSSVNT